MLASFLPDGKTLPHVALGLGPGPAVDSSQMGGGLGQSAVDRGEADVFDLVAWGTKGRHAVQPLDLLTVVVAPDLVTFHRPFWSHPTTRLTAVTSLHIGGLADKVPVAR